jgi:hypothetical protein
MYLECSETNLETLPEYPNLDTETTDTTTNTINSDTDADD